jgi:deoxyribodipyrimidine photo-lyase
VKVVGIATDYHCFMTTALVWFRRDLRLDDHTALHRALTSHEKVHCVFIFDRRILDGLLTRKLQKNRRVEFMLAALTELDAALRVHGGGLIVRHGLPEEEIPRLAAELDAETVYINRDYDPAAISRDVGVAQQLQNDSRELHESKDQVIFERSEVLTQTGMPFSVFTPYKNAWLKRLMAAPLRSVDVESHLHRLAPLPASTLPPLEQLGFAPTNLCELSIPTGMSGAQKLFQDFVERIDHYAERRDFPALKGPSYLSAHLRFGTMSIRQIVAYAQAQPSRGAEIWLSELIWRDFYQMILWHHPHVVTQSFKPAFDVLQWDDAPDLFAAWCEGRTGYPLVDAAMRQLNHSGYMHNRLRMVTASFLTKDLGIDWRLGERYFADQLIDYDLAANNGGWQWAASTGCDAQPWFRIFNPITQSEKFDGSGKFIRRYVPELARISDKHIHAPWLMSEAEQGACGGSIGRDYRDYPLPAVDHATARARTLARFGKLKEQPRL